MSNMCNRRCSVINIKPASGSAYEMGPHEPYQLIYSLVISVSPCLPQAGTSEVSTQIYHRFSTYTCRELMVFMRFEKKKKL